MNEIITQKFKDEKRKLLSYINSRVGDPDESEDILQEVFESAVLNFNTIKSIEAVTSWLFSVARNKISDFFRRKKRESLDPRDVLELEDLIEDKDSDIENSIKIEIFTEKLSEIISSMPEKLYSVFVYHELELLTFREISEITGTPVNTLISRKREAVVFLREKLKSFKEDICF
ncbi:RNA polymerase sigma factor [candidate division WOR-3 bacterium]|nr:RNA polymerase sigma factor [candidate division WOR-3 bacterium]